MIDVILNTENSIKGTEKMIIFLNIPLEIKIDPNYNLSKKEVSIILQKYFPSNISNETKAKIESATQTIQTASTTTFSFIELLMSFQNLNFFTIAFSMLFGFSKFLKLVYPENILICFKLQIQNAYQ